MNATTFTSNSKKPVRRGFLSLPCILCGNADGNVAVSLDDVSQFHCNECDGDFDADAVQQQIAQWQAVLAWIGAAPVAE
jgi:hypothetical protein